MLLLVAFVVLAEELGLESILGAFVAGALVGLLDRDSTSHPQFRVKLEAVGYGFLIPVFFVASGLRLDISGLVSSGEALARVPVFLVVLVLARGLPALLYLSLVRRPADVRRRAAAGDSCRSSWRPPRSASSPTVSTDHRRALVCAGLLSVLLFPAAATALGLEEPVPSPRKVF